VFDWVTVSSLAFGNADNKKRDLTYPELLERIRLSGTLPEQRGEIHAVAFGLKVGNHASRFLHVFRGYEVTGKGKAASEIVRDATVFALFFMRSAGVPVPP
tara:strand:+ start:1935 stop:2237 length:303 start_codon:yes stop_codon:yes gene_type:complete